MLSTNCLLIYTNKNSCTVFKLVNLDIMDTTVAQSVFSHCMDIHVLQDVTVVPTTVIMPMAVNNRQR